MENLIPFIFVLITTLSSGRADYFWVPPRYCDNSFCNNNGLCLLSNTSLSTHYPDGEIRQCRCTASSWSQNCTHDEGWLFNCIHHVTSFTITANSNTDVLNIKYGMLWLNIINYTQMCYENSFKPGQQAGLEYNLQFFSYLKYWCNGKRTCNVSLTGLGPNPAYMTAEYSFISVQKTRSYCETGYYYEDSCYELTPKYFSAFVNEQQALQHCREKGGDLALDLGDIDFIIDRLIDSPYWGFDYVILFDHCTEDGWCATAQRQIVQDYWAFPGSLIRKYNWLITTLTPSTTTDGDENWESWRGLCVFAPSFALNDIPSTATAPPQTTTTTQSTPAIHFCPGVNLNGLCGMTSDYQFPQTTGGTRAKKACPNGFTGFAFWDCAVSGIWQTTCPDFSGCTSRSTEGIVNDNLENLNSGADPSDVLQNATTFLQNSTQLIGGDLYVLTDFMQTTLSVQSSILDNDTLEFDERSQKAKNFTDSILLLGDFLSSKADIWWSLPATERAQVFQNFSFVLLESVFQVAKNILLDDVYIGRADHLIFRADLVSPDEYQDEEYSFQFDAGQLVTLPPKFQQLIDVRNGTEVELSFVVKKNAWEILSTPELKFLDTMASNNIQQTSSVRIVQTPVVEVTVGEPRLNTSWFPFENQTVKLYLKADVPLEFKYVKNRRQVHDILRPEYFSCSYWDYNMNDWSSYGCRIPQGPATYYTCECNHLSNFAVIMDVNGIIREEFALEVITHYGGVISATSLAVLLIIYIFIIDTQHIQRIIAAHLCLSLFTAQVLLLAGLEATEPPLLCCFMGVFIHLFYLCSFSWIFLEGLHVAFKLVKPFSRELPLRLWQYYVIGYGIPFVIVLVCFEVTMDDTCSAYSSPDTCWITDETVHFYGFVIPIALVIGFNMIALTTTLNIICCKKFEGKGAVHDRQPTKKRRKVVLSIILSFVFGVTWIFGFLYVTQATVGFAYVFTILNSFQGLFVSYFFCFGNKEVRKETAKRLKAAKDVVQDKMQQLQISFKETTSSLRCDCCQTYKPQMDETESCPTATGTVSDPEHSLVKRVTSEQRENGGILVKNHSEFKGFKLDELKEYIV